MSGPAVITSPHNPLAANWRALNRSRAARREQRSFIAEGEHMVTEALRDGQVTALAVLDEMANRFRPLIGQADRRGIPVSLVSRRVLEAVADTRTPQGVFCVCGMPPTDALPPLWLVCALENVQDPGNVGTVLRTMDAVSSAGVLLDGGCADVFSPKTLRASMGAVFRVPVWVAEDFPEALRALKSRNYRLMAGALDGEPFYSRPADADRTCLLIGNEGQGLSDEALAIADCPVRLPMEGGAESLNAAVACAVMAYDLLRRRHDPS